ncbi:MAG: hypothetical protein OSB68_09985 [Dehalococcoidia bacterium]|nr:hypothetical protein [Dehalococcoidia bacterium]
MNSDDIEAKILKNHPKSNPQKSIASSLIALAMLLVIIGIIILWMWMS